MPAHPRNDVDSAAWVSELTGEGASREAAIARLHTLLLRIARAEANRRSVRLGVIGPELDDIAHQAADDALVAVIGKIGQFRGESKFTTWAYKFVIFEVAGKINRHHWQRRTVPLEHDEWERLPGRFGMQPDTRAEWGELMSSVQRAVDERLTPRQRTIFVSLVVHGKPLDALVLETGSNRNAIYKVMFDARRKIRAALVADGHIRDDSSPLPARAPARPPVTPRPRRSP